MAVGQVASGPEATEIVSLDRDQPSEQHDRRDPPVGFNNLLAMLSASDKEAIAPHLRLENLPQKTVLEEADEPIETVFFPVAGVASIITVGDAGRGIETGLFGWEGMSGTALLLESRVPPNTTVMQVEGRALAVDAEVVADLMQRSATFRGLMHRYVLTMMVQTAHTVVCNTKAKLEERLARWILMCHDRIIGDRLDLTHEFLSTMLGVRRAGVTVGLHVLEGKGMIRSSRGSMLILDRESLAQEAGHSYGAPEEEYDRLIGWSRSRPDEMEPGELSPPSSRLGRDGGGNSSGGDPRI